MKKTMMRSLLVNVLLMGLFGLAHGQDTALIRKEATYTKMITERSDKIVAKLGITDSAKYIKVRSIIATQYRDLNTIYEERDAKKQAVKVSAGNNKQLADTGIKMIEDNVTTKVDVLHKQYISKLSQHLNPNQVEQVKDGMTYSVLPITYKGYQDMIPTLTAPQKTQIYDWLVEAREHAMDAESSDKKHAWFGKYKGRINNYLSAQGYDAQKERAAWEARVKAAGGRL